MKRAIAKRSMQKRCYDMRIQGDMTYPEGRRKIQLLCIKDTFIYSDTKLRLKLTKW